MEIEIFFFILGLFGGWEIWCPNGVSTCQLTIWGDGHAESYCTYFLQIQGCILTCDLLRSCLPTVVPNIASCEILNVSIIHSFWRDLDLAAFLYHWVPVTLPADTTVVWYWKIMSHDTSLKFDILMGTLYSNLPDLNEQWNKGIPQSK